MTYGGQTVAAAERFFLDDEFGFTRPLRRPGAGSLNPTRSYGASRRSLAADDRKKSDAGRRHEGVAQARLCNSNDARNDGVLIRLVAPPAPQLERDQPQRAGEYEDGEGVPTAHFCM